MPLAFLAPECALGNSNPDSLVMKNDPPKGESIFMAGAQ